jgi:hypothetical protein
VKRICAIDALVGDRTRAGKGSSVSEIVGANRPVDGVVEFRNALGGWGKDFALATARSVLLARRLGTQEEFLAAFRRIGGEPFERALDERAREAAA